MKKRKLKWQVKVVFLVVFVLVFGYCIYSLGSFFLDMYRGSELNKKIIDEVVIPNQENGSEEDSISIDFDKLLSINPEVKAWIQYNNRIINYPIVQRKNNVYYLYRAIDGSVNSTGTIFMDYRNHSFDDQNVVLYGHNMVDNTMFGSLDDVFQNNFFDEESNHFIEITLPDNTRLRYQIFSYYTIEKEEYYITTNFSSNKAFQQFLNDMKNRSERNFDLELNENDKVLTLSTCNGVGGTTKRIVVHAKRVD